MKRNGWLLLVGRTIFGLLFLFAAAGLAACSDLQESVTLAPPETGESALQDPCLPPAISQDDHPYIANSITYVDPTPIEWETADPEQVGLDAARLEAAAEEAALSETVASLLVIRDGKLVFERYFNGSDATQANNTWSLSKSILSVVAGAAIAEELFGLDTPIGNILLPDLTGTNGGLTVRHLLTMSAGLQVKPNELDYDEDLERNGSSLVRAVLSRPSLAAPGERIIYSSGLTQVLSAVIAEAAGVSTCTFAHERLFDPLGIDVEHWLADPDGYHAGGHAVFMTPREIGRFGQFVLQGGEWQGEQLVPADWLSRSMKPVWEIGCRPFPTSYGYLWWLEEVAGYQVWTASGAGGQDLHIVPDLDLVLVMTHDTSGEAPDLEEVASLSLLERYVLDAVTDEDRQPARPSSCSAPPQAIETIRPDGSGRTIILNPPTTIAPWSWSPNGSRIAFHANLDLNDEIYTMAADGKDFQRLTHELQPDTMPAWSPDGSTIVFSRGRPSDSDLYSMKADGSEVVQLTDLPGYEHSPTWSPDGRTIAFTAGDASVTSFGSGGQLWVMDADGSNARLLLDQQAGSPDWSPDGRFIAFEARGGETSVLSLLDLESGAVTELGTGEMPDWSPDGARLVFVSDRDGSLDLYIMATDGTEVQQLTSGPERETLPGWSPDGDTILFVSFSP